MGVEKMHLSGNKTSVLSE